MTSEVSIVSEGDSMKKVTNVVTSTIETEYIEQAASYFDEMFAVFNEITGVAYNRKNNADSITMTVSIDFSTLDYETMREKASGAFGENFTTLSGEYSLKHYLENSMAEYTCK